MSFRKERVVLNKALKTAIIKCYEELCNAYAGASLSFVEKKVANIFSCSASAVNKIIKVYIKGQPIEDPHYASKPKSQFYNNYQFKEELTAKIYALHKNNEFFTMEDLHYFAKKELDFTMSQKTLARIVKSMGYKYKKVNGRKVLVESPRLKATKIKFLRKYLQYLKSEEKIVFVYLDETWIYQNGSPVRQWVHDEDRRGNPAKIGLQEGKRFTVLHAGCRSGFVDGCCFLLDSKVDSRDYHKTMNGDIFKKWLEEQLIPSLTDTEIKYVVVMDNAPYHSMLVEDQPRVGWAKSKLQTWLQNKQIQFDVKATKKQLWDIIKQSNLYVEKKYVVDQLLLQKNIDVLRLPPYHCQYNPIEMVWGFCKTYYNKHIRCKPKSKTKVRDLWQEAISKFTGEMWNNSVEHCEKLIQSDWERLMGNCNVDDIPPIIISLADSDSEDESVDFEENATSTNAIITWESDKVNVENEYDQAMNVVNECDQTMNVENVCGHTMNVENVCDEEMNVVDEVAEEHEDIIIIISEAT